MKYQILALAVMGVLGCKPSRHEFECEFHPPGSDSIAGKQITDCVNAATAKQTGENQDAESWVLECGNQMARIYYRPGMVVKLCNSDRCWPISECLDLRKAYDSSGNIHFPRETP